MIIQPIELATGVASLADFELLDGRITDLSSDLVAAHQAVADRIDGELLPLLDEMQTLLSQRGEQHESGLPTWTKWYEAFCARMNKKMSLRTVQRKLKQLRGATVPVLTDANVRVETDAIVPPLHELKGGRELLTAHIERMKDALKGESFRSDTDRIDRSLSLLEDLQHAIDEGLLSPPDVSGDSAKHTLAPALTRMMVPTVSSQDANEALWQAATSAAITAANGVSEGDIKPRFQPSLMFYTNRQTVKFGRMLKKNGIESHSSCGKTCYDFPAAPAYFSYEEAWAYASSFAAALPGIDVAYRVYFVDEQKNVSLISRHETGWRG